LAKNWVSFVVIEGLRHNAVCGLKFRYELAVNTTCNDNEQQDAKNNAEL
jgi:hypothetical protein